MHVYLYVCFSEAVDKTQDQLKWQQEIEEEVTELKEEHEEEYSLKMRLYKEQMDKWEKTKVLKVHYFQFKESVVRYFLYKHI